MKTRLWCIALLASIGLNINAQSAGGNSTMLMATEICVANIDQTIDYSNNYGGWIELYNPTASGISLDDWYISDDAGTLQEHRLTGYGVLSPCSYKCVFFDHNALDGEYGAEASKQVRFKLNRNGGTLYLSKNGKDIELSFTYPESVPRCSYARIRLDSDDWQYCGMPTPGSANAGLFAQGSLPVPVTQKSVPLCTFWINCK